MMYEVYLVTISRFDMDPDVDVTHGLFVPVPLKWVTDDFWGSSTTTYSLTAVTNWYQEASTSGAPIGSVRAVPALNRDPCGEHELPIAPSPDPDRTGLSEHRTTTLDPSCQTWVQHRLKFAAGLVSFLVSIRHIPRLIHLPRCSL